MDGINTFGAAGGAQPDLTTFWKINTEYEDATGTSVSAAVAVAGQFTVTPPSGNQPALTDATIQALVVNTIAAASWPRDSTAVYHVLVSQEVVVAAFCNVSCSYHGSFAAPGGGQNLLYLAALDSTKQCHAVCQPQYQATIYGYFPPNSDRGADSMVGLIAHELSDVATNPDVSGGLPCGWFDEGSGYENSDYCAYHFGTPFKPGTPGPGLATHYGVNGRSFLVQQQYSPALKACVNYKGQGGKTTRRLLQKL